jgi:hypothetical protein
MADGLRIRVLLRSKQRGSFLNETSINSLVDRMPAHVRQEDLVRAWDELAKSLSLDPRRGMEIIISVPRDVSLEQEGRRDSAWGGAWEWNISDGATKAAVVSVLVAAALFAVGAGTGLAPVLIPTVIPFLFDVKRVQLERTADGYLRILGARSDTAGRSGSIDSLYESLPADVRGFVSRVDFEGFLRQGVDVGRAEERDNGTFEVLPNGESAFRIKIR